MLLATLVMLLNLEMKLLYNKKNLTELVQCVTKLDGHHLRHCSDVMKASAK